VTLVVSIPNALVGNPTAGSHVQEFVNLARQNRQAHLLVVGHRQRQPHPHEAFAK